MAIDTSAYTNAYYNSKYGSYLFGNTGSTSSSSSPFDVSSVRESAKAQADELLKQLEGGSSSTSTSSVKTLKADTAKFLDDYTLSMKKLEQSSDKLRLGNLDRTLFDYSGERTDETVKKTVDAVQDMVSNYNDTLKLLDKNADRGPGVVKQLARMVDDPIAKESMAMLGVSVNKDGTLALDTEKLTEALNTEDTNQLNLYKDLLGGFNGLADNVRKDAISGQNTSASALVGNDIATMQTQQKQENPFIEMYSSLRGNVYNLMNQAVGQMLNMLV